MRREQSFGLAPGHWAMVEPLAASSMIGDLALMFAVKGWDAIERPSGAVAVGRNRPELRRAGSGARDDG